MENFELNVESEETEERMFNRTAKYIGLAFGVILSAFASYNIGFLRGENEGYIRQEINKQEKRIQKLEEVLSTSELMINKRVEDSIKKYEEALDRILKEKMEEEQKQIEEGNRGVILQQI